MIMRLGLASKDAGERYAAADRLLRHWERLSRLEGLDAPAKTDVTSGGEVIKVVGIDLVRFTEDNEK